MAADFEEEQFHFRTMLLPAKSNFTASKKDQVGISWLFRIYVRGSNWWTIISGQLVGGVLVMSIGKDGQHTKRQTMLYTKAIPTLFV